MLGTLLLIDDEPKLRQLMARILSLEEFKVLEADTARSGLRMLQQAEVHVVVCDVKLPDVNPPYFKRWGKHPGVKAIVDGITVAAWEQ